MAHYVLHQFSNNAKPREKDKKACFSYECTCRRPGYIRYIIFSVISLSSYFYKETPNIYIYIYLIRFLIQQYFYAMSQVHIWAYFLTQSFPYLYIRTKFT